MKFLSNRYLITLTFSAVFFLGLAPSVRAHQTGELSCAEISDLITEVNHLINENGDRRHVINWGSGDGHGTLSQLKWQYLGLGRLFNASRIAQMEGELDSINLNFVMLAIYNESLEAKRIKYCDKTLINNSYAAKIHSVDTDHADENSSQAGTKITSDEARK